MKTRTTNSNRQASMKNTRKPNRILTTSIAALLGVAIFGLSPAAKAIEYWDGPNVAPNGIIDGGTGTWDNAATTNWTNSTGTANFTYTAGTNPAVFQGTAGTVTIGGGNVISFSELDFVTNGYIVSAAAGGVLALNNATNTIIVSSPGTATINAQMVNGAVGGLTVGNAGVTGTLVLTNAANNYAGGTTLNGTTTLLNNAATTTLGLGAVTINGAGSTFGTTLAATTISNDINVNANFKLVGGAGGVVTLTNLNLGAPTHTITGGTGTTFNITGTIAGAAGVTYENTGGAGGSFVYGATEVSTYTGVTTVQNNATLALNSSTPNSAIIGGLTIGGGGTVTLLANNQIADNNAVSVNTGGTFNMQAFNETIKSLNSTGAGGGVVTGSGTLTVTDSSGGAGAFNGNISANTSLVKNGLATDVLTLGGINSYTGTTLINGGIIKAGSVTGLSLNSNFALIGAPATLDLAGFSNTIAGLVGGVIGSTVESTTGTATLTFGSNAVSTVFNGNIINGGGTLGITKVGAGVETLGGINTYSGATTMVAGGLQAGSTTAFSANSAFVVQTGSQLSLNGFNNTIASLSDGGTTGGSVINSAAAAASAVLTFGDATPTTTFKGTIANGGGAGATLGITKQGAGIAILGGLNTYTGATTINAGTLQAGIATQAFGIGSAVTINGTGAMDLAGFNETIGSLTGAAGTFVKNSTNQAATLTTGDATNTTFAGVIQDGGLPGGLTSLTKVGAGTFKLAGANTYTGATNINVGTLQMGIVGALSTGTDVTVAAAATFDLNNFNQSIGSLAGAAGSSVTLGTAVLTTGNDSLVNTTFTGVISGTAVTSGLTKVGTGIFTLDGAAANTYAGPTRVNDGTLVLNKTAGVNAIGSGVGGLFVGDGAGAAASAIVRLSAANQIADATAVTIASDGRFDLNGLAETVGSVAGASATAQITLGAGTLTTGDINNTAYAGSINGVGGNIVKNGIGTWTLSGLNTYTGTTTINAGKLLAGSTTAFGTGSAVTLTAAGATLDLGSFSNSIGSLSGVAGTFVKNTGVPAAKLTILGNNGAPVTFAGNMLDDGPLGLDKNGPGTQILSGINTYTGDTNVNGGILEAGSTTALSTTSKFFVNTGGILALGDAGTTGFNNTILALTDTGLPGGTVQNGGTAAKVLTFGDANSLTFHGNIINGGAGTLGLTKVGAGAETLSGVNTYAGPTVITAGSLIGGSTTAFGTNSAVNINNGATLDLGGFNNSIGSLDGLAGSKVQNSTGVAATLTTGGLGTPSAFAGNIVNGAGAALSLTKTGAGIQTLSGANTYTGTTTINAGAILAGSATALSGGSAFLVNTGGTLTLNGFNNTILSLSDNGAAGGTVQNAFATNAILTFGDANNLTFHGTIINGAGAGTLALVKNGAGAETLSGANTYTGPTTVNAGRLIAGNATAFGVNSAVTLTAAGATLDIGGNNIAIGSLNGVAGSVVTDSVGSSTLTTGSLNQNATFAGNIVDGPGAVLSLNKLGTGILTLSGNNTYSGTTTIGNGLPTSTLLAGSTTALSAASAFQINSNGLLDLGGFNNTILSLSGLAGSAIQNSGLPNAILTFGNSASLTYAGNIVVGPLGSGTLGITKNGTGIETLSGVNNYTGPTTVNAGRLQAGVATVAGVSGAFGLNSAVNLTGVGATLDLGGFSNTIGSLTGVAGSLVQSSLGAATLTTGTLNTDTTFAGIIQNGVGPLGLTKVGNGKQTLSGLNTYTGATIVNGGFLVAGSTQAFGVGSAATVAFGATLDLNGFNNSIFSLSGAGTVKDSGPLAARLTITNGGGAIFSGNMIDDGVLGLTKSGVGIQILSGVNTYSGDTIINGPAGSVLQAGSITAFSPNSAFLVNTGGALDLFGFNNTIKSLSDADGIGGTVQNGGAVNAVLTFGDANNLTYHGNIVAGPGAGTLGITKVGAGTETLTGVNTYTGPTTINAGALLAGSGTAFGTNSLVAVNLGGTLDLGGFSNTIGALTSGVLGGTVKNGGAAAATLTLSGIGLPQTFAGNIINVPGAGPLSLTKNGAGTQKLSGVNTYIGATTINAGALLAGSATAFGTNSAVNLTAAGATLDLGGFSNSIGSLTGIAGTIVQTTGGPATLTTGSDGQTTTFSGVLQDGPALAPLSLTKVGGGTFTLAGAVANTYAGTTRVNDGTLVLNKTAGVTALGTGAGGLFIGDGAGAAGTDIVRLLAAEQIADITAVTIASDGRFDLNGVAPGETVGSIAGVAGAQITLGANVATTLTTGDVTNTTYAGSINGSGNIVKQGIGTWTVSGLDTYTGKTTVNAGRLLAGSTTAFGVNSAVTVNANSILDLGGNSNSIGSLAGGGVFSFVQSTGGPATLTTGGDNTSTGYSGIIRDGTGPLSLVKGGSGTQALSGPSSYTGGTILNSGGLHVDNNFALGTGTLKIFNIAPGGTTLGSTVAGIVFANAIEIHADFAVDPVFGGVGTLKATGAVTLFGTHTITGTNTNTFEINGAVGESAAGTGILFDPVISSNFVYSGPLANTYTGLTTVEGGATLTLFKDNPGIDAIPSGGLKVQDTATVILKQNEQINNVATVTLVNSGLFNLNGFNETVMTLNTDVGTTTRLDNGAIGGTLTVTTGLINGLITDTGFPGNLVKNGAAVDVLTLSHANTYAGLTTLNGGLLNINHATALGTSTLQIMDVGLVGGTQLGNTSGAPVTFINKVDIFNNFAVNGPGALTADGVTTLRQLNTTINTVAGGLNFGTAGGVGAIGEFNPLSNLTFTGNTATTFAGINSNTYTGQTNLLGGILTLSKTLGATAIAGNLNIALGTTAKFGAGAAATNNQIAIGSNVNVIGTLDLNGHNQEINNLTGSGDVRLGDAALTPGKLMVHSGVFSGNIMDAGPSGQLVKNTPGTLILTGKNTLTGTTSVQKGSLILDGSVGGDVNVSGPGFLGGTGWIGGSLFNSGVVSPGHSPGTLTVNGNFAQSSGGLLKIEVGGLAPNEHDLLAIHGAAFLNGTVEVIRTNNFALMRHDKVIFLTADGGVNGKFSNELNQFHVGNALLDGVIIYEPFDVALTLVQNSFLDVLNHFTQHGLTPNQKAVAKALDRVLNDPRMDAALNYLDSAPLGSVPHLLDLIAAEELQSIYTIGISQANVQSSNLERRMDDIRSGTHGFSASGYAVSGGMPQYSGSLDPSSAPGLSGPEGKGGKEIRPPLENPNMGIFVTGVGEFTHVGNTYNASGYDLATGGFTLGVDYRIGDHFAIGINAGYARTSADLFGNGRVSVDGGKLGVYATFFTGGFYADLSAQGGYNSYDTRRTALAGTARGTTNGGEFNALFATGYDFKTGGLSIGPTASVQYTYVGFRGFTETGSLLPLAYNKQNGDSLRTSIGMKASYDWQIGGITVRPELRAAWQHEFDNTEFAINSRFANGAGNTFTVHGAETGRESLLLGAGVAVLWNERTSTYVYYDGEIGRTNFDSHNVSGGVRLSF